MGFRSRLSTLEPTWPQRSVPATETHRGPWLCLDTSSLLPGPARAPRTGELEQLRSSDEHALMSLPKSGTYLDKPAGRERAALHPLGPACQPRGGRVCGCVCSCEVGGALSADACSTPVVLACLKLRFPELTLEDQCPVFCGSKPVFYSRRPSYDPTAGHTPSWDSRWKRGLCGDSPATLGPSSAVRPPVALVRVTLSAGGCVITRSWGRPPSPHPARSALTWLLLTSRTFFQSLACASSSHGTPKRVGSETPRGVVVGAVLVHR